MKTEINDILHIIKIELMMETNQIEGDTNNTNICEQEPGAETDETMQMEEGQVHTTTVLDELSLQQLMDSGTVSEDRIIATIQNKHGECQTEVLSRQDAEALGTQLDPVEQPVEDEQGLVTITEELEGMAEQVDQESDMQQTEDMTEYNAENVEKSEFQEGLQAGIPSDLQSELKNYLQDELQQDLQDTSSQEKEIRPEIPPELQPKSQEPFSVMDAELGLHVDTPVPEAISTVSDQNVQQHGEDGCNSSDDAVISNIVQNYFNPYELNQPNFSIEPSMVDGKGILFLTLPASLTSALLNQTGSPLSHSFTEGEVTRRLKVVIPPRSLSNSAGSSVTNSASVIHQETEVVEIPISQQKTNNNSERKTAGPARLDPDTLPSSSSGLFMPSPVKSSSKPFLASLSSSMSTTTQSASLTLTPTPVSKPPLGSTENPIKLVQQGRSFRNIQPLNPAQLKDIASVLRRNKLEIQSRAGEVESGTDEDGGERRLLYDEKFNATIVYREVTPGDSKKTPSTAGVTTTTGSNTTHGTKTTPIAVKSSSKKTLTPALMTPKDVRECGRGRGRSSGKKNTFGQKRKLFDEEESSSEPLPATTHDTLTDPIAGTSSVALTPAVTTPKVVARGKGLSSGQKKASARKHKPASHEESYLERLHSPPTAGSESGNGGGPDGVKAGDDAVDSEHAKSNARVTLQVVIPGELKKTPSKVGVTTKVTNTTPKQEKTSAHKRKLYNTEEDSERLPAIPRKISRYNLITSMAGTDSVALTPAATTTTGVGGLGGGQSSGRKKASARKHKPTSHEESYLERLHSPPTAGSESEIGGGADRHQADEDAVASEQINLQVNEIVNQVVEGKTDEEVVDVAGPRLSTAMSSWEYLLLRVQQEDEGNSSASLIPRILNEVTSLFDRVSCMTARHLHPHINGGDGGGNGEEHEPYQLTNPETARLLGLQCGTYFISKDERKLLEEDAVNSAHLSQTASSLVDGASVPPSTALVAVIADQPQIPVAAVVVPPQSEDLIQQQEEQQQEDDAQLKAIQADSAAAAASKLWEELEEADHLPPTAGSESGIGGGPDGDQADDDAVDSELMQVDEIVNQVVEGQTGGSQAPSPL